jgi:hypothetical protein
MTRYIRPTPMTINYNDLDPPGLGKRFVEAMTNWQRSQWAKAGYPGLSRSNYDANKIRPFLLKFKAAK